MNINRNNYEEYFLLYVDNELSAADKKAVDEFVVQNPDLQNELLMLKQSVLNDNDISFEGKEVLLKDENAFAAIQEKLLLHLDDELDAETNAEIKNLITTNESIAMEWEVLQKTKLPAGTSILFENKAVLYKHTGRVLAFPWRSIAAAAVLTGFGVWGYISFFDKENAINPDVVIVKDNIPGNKMIETDTPDTTIGIIENNTSQATVAVGQEQTKYPNSITKKQRTDQRVTTNTGDDKNIAVTKKASAKPDDDIADPALENINNLPGNKTVVRNVQQEKQERILPEINNKVSLANKETPEEIQMPNEKNKYATLVSTQNPESENDDRIFYVKESKLKKTKAGVFLSKAKRLLNRNIAGDGINSIAVGNIEIAIK